MPPRKKTTAPKPEAAEPLPVTQVLPPGGPQPVIPAVQQYAGVFSAGNKFYRNADEAMLTSRENAWRMWYDLDIQDPLQARILATAQLPGHVEPEDKKDPVQLERAKDIQHIIDSIPGFLKYKVALLHAIWFGKAGVQNEFEWAWDRKRRKVLQVRNWSPVHGDSIVWKWDDTSKVGVLVGPQQGEGTRRLTTEPTDFGLAHVLTDWEREAFVLHTHLHLGNDFLKIEKAGTAKGVGLRDTLYWTWYLKQEMMGLVQEYLERVGLGITVYYYEAGNDASLAAVKDLAESQTSNTQIFWPRSPGDLKGAAGIERIEPSSAGVSNFMSVIKDYFGGQIKRVIAGQDLTSESHATGLGSGVADAHENTFMRLVTLDAVNLQETLTHQLVRVIHKYSFPGDDFDLRYKIAVDRPDPLQYLEAAEKFFNMGGALDEDEVRSVLGLTKPDVDAAVLQKDQGVGQPAEQSGEQPAGLDVQQPAGPPSDEDAADEIATLLADVYGAMGVAGVQIDRDGILNKIKGVSGQPAEAPVAEAPEGAPEGATNQDQEVQDAALNGAQIASLLEITDKLATRQYPAEATEAIIRAAFPLLSDQQIKDIIDPLVKAKPVTPEPQKILNRAGSPPWPGAVFDEGKHRWVNPRKGQSTGGGKDQPTAPQGAKEAVRPSAQDTWEGIAADLKSEHAEELADPTTEAKARGVASRVAEKVYSWMMRVDPYIIPLVAAVIDTPQDFAKLGYAPSVSGVDFQTGDPVKAATGVSAHLAASIATKVLAAGVVYAKNRLRPQPKMTSARIGRRLVAEMTVPTLKY